MNREWNIKNPNQGSALKVLCVCSAGLLRSPTLSIILAQEPWNYNTRAVGTEEDFALVPVDEVMLDWANIIICADYGVADRLCRRFPDKLHIDADLVILRIPDEYQFMDPTLVEEIKKQCMDNPYLPINSRRTLDQK